jgi:hypothetical protein
MRFGLATVSALALAGCAATIPPAQVTRFHLNQPIAPDSFEIAEPGHFGPEDATYRAAVVAELLTLGFKQAPTAARYRLTIDHSRDERAAAPRRSPITIGIGGGTGGYGGGVGLGASFGLGGNKSRSDIVTRISVRMTQRTDNATTWATIWEGRAETVAPSGAPSAQPGLAAQKLASALFRGFPGESGRTITVP